MFNRAKKHSDGLQTYCRACQAAHYRGNSIRHRANAKLTRERRRDEARAAVMDALRAGCVDCGNSDVRVLHFDHVRGTKVQSISTMVRVGAGLAKILEEIDKCEVRCANCHAIATYERLGGSWRSNPRWAALVSQPIP